MPPIRSFVCLAKEAEQAAPHPKQIEGPRSGQCPTRTITAVWNEPRYRSSSWELWMHWVRHHSVRICEKSQKGK